MRTFNRLPAAALALLAGIFVFSAAYAQDTVITAEPWVGIFFPYVDLVMRGIIAALIGLSTGYIYKKWGIEVEKEHRDAFQLAATNAAGWALQKAAAMGPHAKIDVGSPFIAEAVRYVQQRVPDALNHFGITPEKIAETIVSKIPQIEATSGPAPLSNPITR